MLKAIVTGGAGFIGSHIARELSERSYEVVIVDDLSTGKRKNIEPLLDRHYVSFVEGSVTDLPLLRDLFRGASYIFHQAAIPSVPRSINDPLSSHQANLTGTLNVLLAAKDSGVRKVIYASSSSVYGDAPTLPKHEGMAPNPLSPYAVTKLAGEYYCRVFSDVYGLTTTCLRYFNVYGPRQDPNSQYAAVIPLFIQKAFHGEPLIIFGDGKQTRDFTFVRDVAEANVLAAENNASGIFNIGRSERTSIEDLAEMILNFTGSKAQVVHRDPRIGDIKHSLADISRARDFGYAPRHSLAEGLKETISAMREEYSVDGIA
jgi:UDP-glucose 4-epimerase